MLLYPNDMQTSTQSTVKDYVFTFSVLVYKTTDQLSVSAQVLIPVQATPKIFSLLWPLQGNRDFGHKPN